MSVFKNIERIQRMHQLILHKRTGTPQEFARKMNLSPSMIYNLIKDLKALGAPIIYCKYNQSYKYSYSVDFKFGFEHPQLSREELRQITGGAVISVLAKMSPLLMRA